MSKGIVIRVVGGCIYVEDNPSKLPVIVHDYDIDGYDEDEYEIHKDKAGHRYTEVEAEVI